MEKKIAQAETALAKLQAHELSLLRLAEPLTSLNPSDERSRSSDASAQSTDNPSPASLAADLGHYKELFSKLRFSYVEQVTKEKFLRAIVGEPPQVVEQSENVELEERLVATKAELKAQKLNVASMVDELQALSRELGERYERIALQKAQLQTVPDEIAVFQQSIAALRGQLSDSSNTTLNLPLPATKDLIRSREGDLAQLQKQLKALQQQLPRKARELERLESDLKPLEVQRAGTIEAAQEAQRRKDDAGRGIGDDIELRGRWFRGAEVVLKETLQA